MRFSPNNLTRANKTDGCNGSKASYTCGEHALKKLSTTHLTRKSPGVERPWQLGQSSTFHQRDFIIGEAVEVIDEAVDLAVGVSVGRWGEDRV